MPCYGQGGNGGYDKGDSNGYFVKIIDNQRSDQVYPQKDEQGGQSQQGGFMYLFHIGFIKVLYWGQIKKATDIEVAFRDSGGIRTHDLRLRRPLLYPAELLNQHLRFGGANIGY